MLDLNFLRDNQELVKQSLINRQKSPELLARVIDLDNGRRNLLSKVEALRSSQNKISKEIKGKPSTEQLSAASKIKADLRTLEDQLKFQEADLKVALEEIPNIPAPDVPVGKDDSENIVWKTVGKIPEFDFFILDHADLGKKLNILDIEKAAEVSGSRFGYYKNQAAVLEMSLMFYAFKKLVSKGFRGMIPPAMIKSETEWGCGYSSNKNLFNAYYSVPEDDLIFISSSEHSVVPYHKNEILDAKDLPIRYVNFSPCFRREAGTYGKDMKGMLRVHFFNKVEMNIFTLPDTKISDAMCLEMLSLEEEILQELGIPYQVMRNCTGDLPQPNRRMYDINSWFPGLKQYRETSSCSNCTDYQARRLNTRVKINGKPEFVHILNATVVTDRVLLALLELNQKRDGSITIPPVLVPFTGFERIAV
ncbi:serine--tRNA ligase [Patescibacteria group bacterium]|nr:serine--tRNA ligase [Patescibacteria group bacterium]